MYTNLPTSQGYIFRTLQHFLTKLCSFSNFDNFFPKIFFVIPRLKIFLKRKSSIDYDTSDEIDVPVENEKKSRRHLFVRQATSNSNCFRYTGITRQKLDLVFDLIKEKAKSLRYWKGSVDTPGSRKERRGAQPRLLSCWEEFVLTLVRTRKGFDVHFLADTFGISVSQVSRIYNT